MCGVIGIVQHQEQVTWSLYEGLSLLQHRGQDAAGLAVCQDKHLYTHKNIGLVREVFTQENLSQLKGSFGIGHVRYPTAGSYTSSSEIQPLYTNYPYGISLAHNGNLVNKKQLREKLINKNNYHLNSETDSEVLLNMLARQLLLARQNVSQALNHEDIFHAIRNLIPDLSGAYAVVGMIPGHGLFAFRDPYGIRPLCLGQREIDAHTTEYCISSESAVMAPLGFEFKRDLAPGEAVYISKDCVYSSQQCVEKSQLRPCLFEHVYLARPDSCLDGISVYQARVSMGSALARRIQTDWPDHDIDVVIPIPESARASALELSYKLGVRYREGLVKNRYIDRTFIMPQGFRGDSVRRKLSIIGEEFKGRNVLLVDDSIVRGTTSGKIISLARHAGAKKIYFASAAPPVQYPNVYGINIPTTKELIAHNSTVEEIAQSLRCDRLFYQDLTEMCQAITRDSGRQIQFEDSCFSGNYLTEEVDQNYLSSLTPLASVAV